jgi:hypothetical protein
MNPKPRSQLPFKKTALLLRRITPSLGYSASDAAGTIPSSPAGI